MHLKFLIQNQDRSERRKRIPTFQFSATHSFSGTCLKLVLFSITQTFMPRLFLARTFHGRCKPEIFVAAKSLDFKLPLSFQKTTQKWNWVLLKFKHCSNTWFFQKLLRVKIVTLPGSIVRQRTCAQANLTCHVRFLCLNFGLFQFHCQTRHIPAASKRKQEEVWVMVRGSAKGSWLRVSDACK